VLGELYEDALAGEARPEIEYRDGRRAPLPVDDWLRVIPGDSSILDRCQGHTLDVGAGPGRLTVALGERGVPALGIDVTPAAVRLARSSGALALHRDVFAAVPGTGRWARVLLADGNIGIGGDPAALLGRVAELLKPAGRALVEVEPPGAPLAQEMVRLTRDGRSSGWFPWASIGADQVGGIGHRAGLALTETWTDAGRWFVSLTRRPARWPVPDLPGPVAAPAEA
jgi:SAM-dependent methyltransferase